MFFFCDSRLRNAACDLDGLEAVLALWRVPQVDKGGNISPRALQSDSSLVTTSSFGNSKPLSSSQTQWTLPGTCRVSAKNIIFIDEGFHPGPPVEYKRFLNGGESATTKTNSASQNSPNSSVEIQTTEKEAGSNPSHQIVETSEELDNSQKPKADEETNLSHLEKSEVAKSGESGSESLKRFDSGCTDFSREDALRREGESSSAQNLKNKKKIALEENGESRNEEKRKVSGKGTITTLVSQNRPSSEKILKTLSSLFQGSSGVLPLKSTLNKESKPSDLSMKLASAIRSARFSSFHPEKGISDFWILPTSLKSAHKIVVVCGLDRYGPFVSVQSKDRERWKTKGITSTEEQDLQVYFKSPDVVKAKILELAEAIAIDDWVRSFYLAFPLISPLLLLLSPSFPHRVPLPPP